MGRTTFLFSLLVVTLLQTTIFNHLPVFHAHYEMLFCFAIFLGVRFDWREGYFGGIACGLFHDLFSMTPFGLSVFTFSIGSTLASLFHAVIFTQHISTRLFIVFIMSILNTGMQLLFLHGSDFFISFNEILKMDILSVAVVNTLFSLPAFLVLEKMFHGYR